MAKFVANREAIDAAKDAAGIRTDDQLARAIEVHPTQLSRVMSGRSGPGERFLAGCVLLFGWDKCGQLFDAVPDPELAGSGSE